MKKNTLLLLLAFAAFQSKAQKFYDLNTIQNIRVYFANTNWDYRMDTARTGTDSYLLADSVIVNNKTFKNCGVKYKGNSSYQASQKKNPLHIQLDFVNAKDYQGYTDIKLGNCWSDNAYIREPLAYSILRQYMDAPLANFAKVWVNDVYYGFMNNAQSIDTKFLLERFYSSNHTTIKCNPEQVGGTGSNLGYSGTALTSYNKKYELQSNDGWSDLIGLCDTLNNKFTSLNNIADIDRFLWMLAFNVAVVNLDSYSGSFRQNYYLYQNHARQWSPIIWDLNMSFGGFPMAGGSGAPLTPATMQTMNYQLHKTESGWPLIFKLLGDPFYVKMYNAHLRTINDENFANGQFKTLAQNLHDSIAAEVQADPNALTSFANFQTSLTANTTGGFGSSPGLFPLMDGRADYLENVLSAAPPVFSNPQIAGGDAFGATVSATVLAENATAVWLGFRQKRQDRFVRVAMFDDGAHDDGAAADGVFGAEMPLLSLEVQYYFYAENALAGAFLPARAEYEFFEILPKLEKAAFGEVVLNEIAANNSDGIENEAGKTADWIELFNTTQKPLALGHLFLSDDATDLARWHFPATAFIAPQEKMLVWADDLDEEHVEHHTNFGLSKSGEAVFLTDSITFFDQIQFAAQAENRSMARCPDGTGAFFETVGRTPRASNACVSRTFSADETAFSFEILPNPTTDVLIMKSSKPIEKTLFYSENGQFLAVSTASSINAAAFPTGIFWAKAVFKDGGFAIRKGMKMD